MLLPWRMGIAGVLVRLAGRSRSGDLLGRLPLALGGSVVFLAMPATGRAGWRLRCRAGASGGGACRA